MLANVELVTLQCAFSWLQAAHYPVWQVVNRVIAKDLEAEISNPLQADTADPALDWYGLITGEWDFVLWSLWIYTVTILKLSSEDSNAPDEHVMTWVDHILK